VLAVGLLRDAIQELRELDKSPITPDKPLPIREAASLRRPNEVDVWGKRRSLGRVCDGNSLLFMELCRCLDDDSTSPRT
jgi:hypothetical protein